jgi:hypothetical protein
METGWKSYILWVAERISQLMAKKCLAQLADARSRKCFVRLSRRFEDSKVRGYVLDVGPEFFLFALVSDRIWFDGFECFRIRDILDVELDPYGEFAEAALKKRGERRPAKPRVNVSSIEATLLSAGKLFPLVTIHRDEVDPNVCWIGRILAVNRGRVSLLEINPDATWDTVASEYRLKEITRVNFGGDYENALHLVGGDPLAI